MKKIIFTALALTCIAFNFTAAAQQDERPEQKERHEKRERPERPKMKEQQEIIIHSKGDTSVTLKVEINGDDVLINGKPLIEFKDNSITINKVKMFFPDGNTEMNLDLDPINVFKDLQNDQSFNFNNFGKQFDGSNEDFNSVRSEVSHKTFLGVTTEKTTKGAKIVEVVKGSAAEKAGLINGDVILKIDKQDVAENKDLAKIISTKNANDAIKITYSRDGKTKTAKAVLGERAEVKTMGFKGRQPQTMVRGFRMKPDNGNTQNLTFAPPNELGFGQNDQMENFFPRQKKLGLKIQDTQEGGNVKVIDVEDSSAAQKAGIQKDDLITEINEQKVTNTDEAREQLQDASEKNAYTIKANRNGTIMSFEVKFPKKLKTANL